VVAGLISKGVDINHIDRDGNTALFLTCLLGHEEHIPTLLAAGATVDTINAKGQNVLHAAALFDQGDQVLL